MDMYKLRTMAHESDLELTEPECKAWVKDKFREHFSIGEEKTLSGPDKLRPDFVVVPRKRFANQPDNAAYAIECKRHITEQRQLADALRQAGDYVGRVITSKDGRVFKIHWAFVCATMLKPDSEYWKGMLRQAHEYHVGDVLGVGSDWFALAVSVRHYANRYNCDWRQPHALEIADNNYMRIRQRLGAH